MVDLWHSTLLASHTPSRWQGTSVKDTWLSWWASITPNKARNLPLLICWAIWLAQNQCMFRKIIPRWHTTSAHILAIYHLLSNEDVTPPTRTIIPEAIN